MGELITSTEVTAPQGKPMRAHRLAWTEDLVHLPADTLALTLAFCAVPLSIAVAESFLGIALIARVARCVRGEVVVQLPRVFWFWVAWAGLETISWLLSPEPARPWGEIRRLFLVAGLFFVSPALRGVSDRLRVWRGIFITSALGSLCLIGDFSYRLFRHRREGVVDSAAIHLRTGGLLHHWMVFGTVEVLVVAGLLACWFEYPEERRRWWPVAALNGLAIIVSLTRMTWVVCLLLLGIELARRRSRWVWALPALPLAIYFLAPAVVRLRVKESLHPNYFSNAERIEMLRVGWRMIRQHPLRGVGAGRVEKLYPSYLLPAEPLPKYHGHLHNNLVQMAAEFGLPVAAAALLFAFILYRDLWGARRHAKGKEEGLFGWIAFLGLTGFLTAGFVDYTYGHSLALILLAFCVLPPLLPASASPRRERLS